MAFKKSTHGYPWIIPSLSIDLILYIGNNQSKIEDNPLSFPTSPPPYDNLIWTEEEDSRRSRHKKVWVGKIEPIPERRFISSKRAGLACSHLIGEGFVPVSFVRKREICRSLNGGGCGGVGYQALSLEDSPTKHKVGWSINTSFDFLR